MQVCSVGGKDWAIFQFRVAPVSDVPNSAHTPQSGGQKAAGAGGASEPEAKAVWGALDPSGKIFGYTTNPYPLPQ
ncbi:hypothetical protein DUNSADRAFT_12693 [Dunaliella salina]|uniref:Encoded protein n=1 Tax=Dunaliella salina TaxID=3046 RepID=A0ABQ7GAT0_DUNSA|nr:hypothetical protein DUNSADRAFT_12693 [Dunaliella salina]|eukprot:KAF5831719.1 hypothetical protein DUNSADRAFT_12693 [Dunaliella salina]